MKKSWFKILFVFVLSFLLIGILFACLDTENLPNWPATAEFTVEYISDGNGTIVGNAVQLVEEGKNGTEITAVPNTGYRFMGWSDGFELPTRKEFKVEQDLTFTALFEKQERTYRYIYNRATSDVSVEDVTLSYKTFGESALVVPQKERFVFNGWYLDEEKTIQATDELGNLILGLEIFDNNSTNLYAKWTAEEEIIYKILMVFVTETKARLQGYNKKWISANYKMSQIERQVCELIPSQMLKVFNEWFDGLVTFEIDSYFTTEAVTAEEISGSYYIGYGLMANDIPEVKSMLKDYRSIITTFGMNDYDGMLHDGGGAGGAKYAFSHVETIFRASRQLNLPIDRFLDVNNYTLWDSVTDHYLHEFTHTAEFCYPAYDIYEYHKTGADLEDTMNYLLNRYITDDGEVVGIPFSFWRGEIKVQIIYYVGANGQIMSEGQLYKLDMRERVMLGGNPKEVTAVPNDGYRFVMWSDGLTTATRQDKNIVEYTYFEAIFEKID